MEIKTTEIKKYIARDGKEFDIESDCRNHEKIETPECIEYNTYMHSDKWEIYEDLVSDGYSFDNNDEDLMGNLKYILSEIEIKIRLNTKTGAYKIISVDGQKLLPEENN